MDVDASYTDANAKDLCNNTAESQGKVQTCTLSSRRNLTAADTNAADTNATPASKSITFAFTFTSSAPDMSTFPAALNTAFGDAAKELGLKAPSGLSMKLRTAKPCTTTTAAPAN